MVLAAVCPVPVTALVGDRHLGISYRDHITNEDVKAGIGNAIGPYGDLLTSVKRRKLKWYGHVTRSSGLAKTILQGTVQGERRRGRQRKRCEDNIKEWTGLEWNIIQRKAENREKWMKQINTLSRERERGWLWCCDVVDFHRGETPNGKI